MLTVTAGGSYGECFWAHYIYRVGKNTGLFSTVNNLTYNNNSNMHKIIYSIQGINVY